jgi:hypothetical protein
VASVAALCLAWSCGGKDEEHGEEGPICSELSELGHEADEAGLEGAAECHDIAHEADEDACDAALADCEVTCAGTAGS